MKNKWIQSSAGPFNPFFSFISFLPNGKKWWKEWSWRAAAPHRNASTKQKWKFLICWCVCGGLRRLIWWIGVLGLSFLGGLRAVEQPHCSAQKRRPNQTTHQWSNQQSKKRQASQTTNQQSNFFAHSAQAKKWSWLVGLSEWDWFSLVFDCWVWVGYRLAGQPMAPPKGDKPNKNQRKANQTKEAKGAVEQAKKANHSRNGMDWMVWLSWLLCLLRSGRSSGL